ncbi:dihydrofolate reductase family protein [Streptomyces sp. NBC_00140]|uniref:dihydrofolate reductase family protein n=1 Tax=Streptomyces sp. NBC_00140 TaxID=2975664 RepID=UPI00224F0D6B|nr:dihydrofolate reductase family protein [Streptomyces sp. NBC_00140]MCX5335709.1 dihydrofolate reductase family protein [Streptomyces sp. NBC_00140]
MRKLVYYIGVSLDGRIAGPADEFDFFPQGDEEQAAAYAAWMNALYPDTVPTAYRAAVGVADMPNRRFGTVVMGRGTYRLSLDHGITNPYAHLRQYVVSSTLEPGTDPAVTVVPSDPLAFVRELKGEVGAGLDVWLCGGGRLAGSVLPEIDELLIKTYPVVAGTGISLFDGVFAPTVFDVAERTAFPNGVTLTRLTRRQFV